MEIFKECQIIPTKTKLDSKPSCFALQKHSPFTELFNKFLNEMRERGVLDKILVTEKIQPQNCPDLSGKPLTMNSCFTAFIALIIG